LNFTEHNRENGWFCGEDVPDGGWVHDDEDIVDGKYCAFLLHFCANVIVALICLTLQAPMHLDIFISNYGKKQGYLPIQLGLPTDSSILSPSFSFLNLNVIGLTSLGDFLELHQWFLLVRKGLTIDRKCNL
jgi:hypothetical protein